MNDRPRAPHRPERILLVLARVGDDFQGRAIRFSSETECRFASLEELGRWLLQVTAQTPAESHSGGDFE